MALLRKQVQQALEFMQIGSEEANQLDCLLRHGSSNIGSALLTLTAKLSWSAHEGELVVRSRKAQRRRRNSHRQVSGRRDWADGEWTLIAVTACHRVQSRCPLCHSQLELVHKATQILPQIHHLFHGRAIRTSQLQHQVQEFVECEGLLLLLIRLFIRIIGIVGGEEVVFHINENQWIHTAFHEGADCHFVLHDEVELFLRDGIIAICVDLVHHLAQLTPDEGDHHVLLLRCGNTTYHLAKHSNEHIHHHERCEGNEGQEDEHVHQVIFFDRIHHRPEIVKERAHDQEGVHRITDGFEVEFTACGPCCQLRESYRENVQEQQQQTQRKEDRAAGGHHSLDENHQLWHAAKHSRKP
mmetsp:Transcript_10585/g.24082  ORF Transcript_10585/g.24082 Transcript_10585/m.24082 type:complete len:355 (-) Transcript_10585:664-1728(-)